MLPSSQWKLMWTCSGVLGCRVFVVVFVLWETWICVTSCVQPATTKTSMHTMSSTKFFHIAILISTSDLNILYYFQWPWPWLKVTRLVAANRLGLYLHTLLNWIRLKFDVVLKQLKANILVLLQSEIFLLSEIFCCFSDCIKNFHIGMHLDAYELISLKHGRIHYLYPSLPVEHRPSRTPHHRTLF